MSNLIIVSGPKIEIYSDIIKAEEIKNYKLRLNEKDIYNLKIQRINNYLYVFLIELKSLPNYFYQKKYDLKSIITEFKLEYNEYNNLSKVMQLINNSYLANKISLLLKEQNKENIFLIISIEGEKNVTLALEKKELEIENKFEMLSKEIKVLKNESKNYESYTKELNELEKITKEVRKSTNLKFKENEKIIMDLLSIVKDNSNFLKETDKEIENLKSEIKSLKQLFETNNEKNEIINNKYIKIKPRKKSKNIFTNIKTEKCSTKSEENNSLFEILLVGDNGVGKNSLISFINNNYSSKLSNIKMEKDEDNRKLWLKYKINNQNYKLIIYNINEKFMEKFEESNKDSELTIAFLVYSIDNYKSFDNIYKWIEIIKGKNFHELMLFLIGNKSDIKERKVTIEEGETLKNKFNLDFFVEISSITGENIKNIFIEVFKILYGKICSKSFHFFK